MQQHWIAIYIAAMVLAVQANVQDLRVEVKPVQTRFAAIQSVNVVLQYTNLGSEPLTLYKWFLPEKELFDPVFEVTRNGEPVNYVGPVVKRRAPIAEDLIQLAPGMTITSIVKVSTAYNMTQTGNYMIQYKMHADQVVSDTESPLKRSLLSSNDEQDFVLESAPITFFAVGRQNPILEQAAQTRALQATYIGCTASQASSTASGVSQAEVYTNGAMSHLNGAAGATTRFTTWFGTYSATNWNTLKSHFSKIQNIFATKSLSFDCTCPAFGSGSGTYAYVYPSQPYKIYLCGAFWPSAVAGTDSKGGTTIHEIAHFTVAAGTADHAYGKSSCQALARSSPAKALANSDNLQYFAENTERYR